MSSPAIPPIEKPAKRVTRLTPLRITLIYALVAVIWIFLSDVTLSRLSPPRHLVLLLEVAKGTLFVAVTSLLLYAMQSKMAKQLAAIREEHAREMEESERRFRTFMDNTPAMAWAKDEHGKYIYLNRPYAQRFGRSVEDCYGITDKELWPGDVVEVFHQQDLAVLRAGTPLEFTTTVREKDGREMYWKTTKFPYKDRDGNPFIGGLGADVTSSETARLALNTHQQQLALFIEHTPAALAMFDREMRYLRVNPRWMSDYQLGDRDIIGKSHYEVFPEIPQRWRDVHARALAGEVIRNTEDVFLRSSGRTQHLRWEVLPWHDRNGEIGGIIIFTEDLTEHFKLRSEVADLQAQFYQSQKMEAIGRLTGGVAHDFNNLLMVISAHAELLRGATADPELLKRIDSIGFATARATDLTRQLLAFSRKQVLQPSLHDVSLVICRMKEMLLRVLGENIRFEVRLDERLRPVMVDRSQLEQVIMNLAVNARDAMSDGGTLTIETSNEKFDIDGSLSGVTIPAGRYVSIKVADNGNGMTAEVKDRIFAPFFTTKGPGKGTGLGLSTVFGIVKQSGGYVLVETKPHQGSTFTILLPASDTAAVTPRQTDAVLKGTASIEGTILVIDDQSDVCHAIADCLRMEGFKVRVADSEQSALEVVKNARDVSLVITDVVLRESSGTTIPEALAEAGHNPKFIFMSGYAEDLQMGALTPGTLFLQKPFDKQALLEKIREANQNVQA